MFLAPGYAKATTLTGAGIIGTDASGNTTGNFWNTLGGDGFYNLYLENGGFLNNGDGDGARININLAPGSYTFNVFGDSGGGNRFGLNLFFNGDDTTPRISVFGPVDSTSFAPNAGVTRQLNGSGIAGANTDTFVDGANTVTLVGYTLNSPVATDLIGPLNNAPNGIAEFTGSFSLRVTGPDPAEAPEPASMMLLGSGLALLLAGSRRLRRS